jgi:hypothetical protein
MTEFQPRLCTYRSHRKVDCVMSTKQWLWHTGGTKLGLIVFPFSLLYLTYFNAEHCQDQRLSSDTVMSLRSPLHLSMKGRSILLISSHVFSVSIRILYALPVAPVETTCPVHHNFHLYAEARTAQLVQWLGYGLDDLGFESLQGRFLSSPKYPDCLWRLFSGVKMAGAWCWPLASI